MARRVKSASTVSLASGTFFHIGDQRAVGRRHPDGAAMRCDCAIWSNLSLMRDAHQQRRREHEKERDGDKAREIKREHARPREKEGESEHLESRK